MCTKRAPSVRQGLAFDYVGHGGSVCAHSFGVRGIVMGGVTSHATQPTLLAGGSPWVDKQATHGLHCPVPRVTTGHPHAQTYHSTNTNSPIQPEPHSLAPDSHSHSHTATQPRTLHERTFRFSSADNSAHACALSTARDLPGSGRRMAVCAGGRKEEKRRARGREEEAKGGDAVQSV